MVPRSSARRPMAPKTSRDNRSGSPRCCAAFIAKCRRTCRGAGFMFWVFHVIRDYARTLEAGNSRMRLQLPRYLALADEMERGAVPLPIVFGHNDLLPANILDDGDRLWLIDFEYAGFRPPCSIWPARHPMPALTAEESQRIADRLFRQRAGRRTLRAFACRHAMRLAAARSDVEHGLRTLSDGARRRLRRLYARRIWPPRRGAGSTTESTYGKSKT